MSLLSCLPTFISVCLCSNPGAHLELYQSPESTGSNALLQHMAQQFDIDLHHTLGERGHFQQHSRVGNRRILIAYLETATDITLESQYWYAQFPQKVLQRAKRQPTGVDSVIRVRHSQLLEASSIPLCSAMITGYCMQNCLLLQNVIMRTDCDWISEISTCWTSEIKVCTFQIILLNRRLMSVAIWYKSLSN